MVFVEPTTCSTANCAVLGALASASPDPAELRSQYAGLVSAQHAMAVVASDREVDDDFLTVDIDGPAVWHSVISHRRSSSERCCRQAPHRLVTRARPAVSTFASVMEP